MMILFYWAFLLLQCVSALADLPKEYTLTSQSFVYPDHIIPISNSDLSLLSGHREYYTLLYITSTDPQHGCDLCHSFDKVVRKVSNYWFEDYGMSNFLFFVNVDIIDRSNADIFKYLEIKRIPHIWLIPPSNNEDVLQQIHELEDEKDPFAILRQPRIEWKVPLGTHDEQVLQFADFISTTVSKRIYIRPENQSLKFIKTFSITFSIIILIKKKGPSILTNNVSKKKIYIALTLFLALLFTCGYSFSVMEKVPFIAKNEKGEVIYISGGIYYQFGIETIMVALNYLLLAFSLVSMIWLGNYKVGPNQKIGTESQKFLLILINVMVLYLLYSCMTSIFLRKDFEYPYYFTKLF